MACPLGRDVFFTWVIVILSNEIVAASANKNRNGAVEFPKDHKSVLYDSSEIRYRYEDSKSSTNRQFRQTYATRNSDLRFLKKTKIVKRNVGNDLPPSFLSLEGTQIDIPLEGSSSDYKFYGSERSKKLPSITSFNVEKRDIFENTDPEEYSRFEAQHSREHPTSEETEFHQDKGPLIVHLGRNVDDFDQNQDVIYSSKDIFNGKPSEISRKTRHNNKTENEKSQESLRSNEIPNYVALNEEARQDTKPLKTNSEKPSLPIATGLYKVKKDEELPPGLPQHNPAYNGDSSLPFPLVRKTMHIEDTGSYTPYLDTFVKTVNPLDLYVRKSLTNLVGIIAGVIGWFFGAFGPLVSAVLMPFLTDIAYWLARFQ